MKSIFKYLNHKSHIKRTWNKVKTNFYVTIQKISLSFELMKEYHFFCWSDVGKKVEFICGLVISVNINQKLLVGMSQQKMKTINDWSSLDFSFVFFPDFYYLWSMTRLGKGGRGRKPPWTISVTRVQNEMKVLVNFVSCSNWEALTFWWNYVNMFLQYKV